MAHRLIDARTTVNDVLRAYPHAISVFRTFGIGSCCATASLDLAARRHDVNIDSLLVALHSMSMKPEAGT